MYFSSVQFSSEAQSCPTLCNPMNRSTPGLWVHHQLLEFPQTHVHRVSDAIQPSHPLSSPSLPAPSPSQYQSLFWWVNGGGKTHKESRKHSSSMALAFRRPFAVRWSMWWGDTDDGRAMGRSNPYGGEGHTAGRSVCGDIHGWGGSSAGKAHGIRWCFTASLPDSWCFLKPQARSHGEQRAFQ